MSTASAISAKEKSSASFSDDDLGLVGRDSGETRVELRAELGETCLASGIGVLGDSLVLVQRLAARTRWRAATSRQVLTTSRWSQVENCDSPRNWPIRTHSLASAS